MALYGDFYCSGSGPDKKKAAWCLTPDSLAMAGIHLQCSQADKPAKSGQTFLQFPECQRQQEAVSHGMIEPDGDRHHS